MSQFIDKYVEACDNCIRSKPRISQGFKQLKPNETPDRRWGTISMDFIMPLPKSEGNTGILVVVDRLTKMAHFITIKKEITALETAETLMRNVFKLHGLPDKIISDRRTQFAAKVIQEMYKKLDITSALSSAYHPQTDGQTERVNQDLETYIQMFCTHRQDDWAKWLHMAEFAYNNKEHSTIKMSPFKANNLTEPRWLMEMKTENMTHPAAEEQLEEMKLVEKELQACLDIAAERMKEYYDKGSAPLLQIGDMAYLDARNLKEKIQEKDEPTRAMTRKLRKKRIGPYRVTDRIGELNYRLQLPKEMMDKKVHDVFHISLLTKAPHDEIIGRRPTNPPPIIIDSEEEWEVEEILDSRFKNRQLQYLVKWTGTNSAKNSWEPDKNLANAPEAISDFHSLHPEAPRRLRAAAFRNIKWKPLENYTLSNKKEEVRRILHSRDLVP